MGWIFFLTSWIQKAAIIQLLQGFAFVWACMSIFLETASHSWKSFIILKHMLCYITLSEIQDSYKLGGVFFPLLTAASYVMD